MTTAACIATSPSVSGSSLHGLAGAGLKGQHAAAILDAPHEVQWFEAHAENYMVEGGPRLAFLSRVRERFPIALHGVAASLGGATGPDRDHLRRLSTLVDRFNPSLLSEHLAWSSHEGVFFNDLLPVRYDAETMKRTVEHIDALQTATGMRILLENPSTYVELAGGTYDEPDFLIEIAQRSGCGLLLDVNNIYVSATNHGWDPAAYLTRMPAHLIGEIHVAGHFQDPSAQQPLLIDSHDRPVAAPVWILLAQALAATGPRPVLVEWDDPVPDWPALAAEVDIARGILMQSAQDDAA